MNPALEFFPVTSVEWTAVSRGMPHGPWTSRDGCEMFEARHRG
jgi:hypothetical protein